jgi:TonB family protein
VLLLAAILTADLTGTWTGTVHGEPMCLALSQQDAEVTGHIAYANDRKYAAISGGQLADAQLTFEVADLDRGTLHFGFRLEGQKLLGDDGALLTKWVPRGNPLFGAGKQVAPSLVSKVDPEFSEQARKEHNSGDVKLGILILTNGEVDRRSVRVLSSAGADLDEKAIEAVVQWKFTPPRADCSFYEKRLTVEVNFRLL